MDKIIAKATRKFPIQGSRDVIIITAQAEQDGGNSHTYFSVTSEIRTPGQLARGDGHSYGCLHDEALKAWPKVKPIIDLHLANADNGEPMYAEANGYYWLAGAAGGLGEQYNGASGSGAKTPKECERILAEHLRIPLEDAEKLVLATKEVFDSGGTKAAKTGFGLYIHAQRERWAEEARAGLRLIQEIAAEAE